MLLQSVYEVAETGDVLATSSNIFVRVLTGHTASHVGMFVKKNGLLYVSEFRESLGKGYRFILFSDWLKDHPKLKKFKFGIAPKIVRDKPSVILSELEKLTHLPNYKKVYGWTTLTLIWFSQIFKIKFPHILQVCSSHVQNLWQATGFNRLNDRIADPGDILNACPVVYNVYINKPNGY